jgi:hypothetical protein
MDYQQQTLAISGEKHHCSRGHSMLPNEQGFFAPKGTHP